MSASILLDSRRIEFSNRSDYAPLTGQADVGEDFLRADLRAGRTVGKTSLTLSGKGGTYQRRVAADSILHLPYYHLSTAVKWSRDAFNWLLFHIYHRAVPAADLREVRGEVALNPENSIIAYNADPAASSRQTGVSLTYLDRTLFGSKALLLLNGNLSFDDNSQVAVNSNQATFIYTAYSSVDRLQRIVFTSRIAIPLAKTIRFNTNFSYGNFIQRGIAFPSHNGFNMRNVSGNLELIVNRWTGISLGVTYGINTTRQSVEGISQNFSTHDLTTNASVELGKWRFTNSIAYQKSVFPNSSLSSVFMNASINLSLKSKWEIFTRLRNLSLVPQSELGQTQLLGNQTSAYGYSAFATFVQAGVEIIL